MPFYPPSWAPKLPMDPPDTTTIADFVLNEKYGRTPFSESAPLFTCGLSGKSVTPQDAVEQVDLLARGLSKELGWQPNAGTEWDKVVGVWTLNTIDTILVAWATHRLGGIDSPANAAYSPDEIEHQLRDSGSKCVFTCLPLLETTLQVTEKLGIPRSRVFLLELPPQLTGGKPNPPGFKTVQDLIKQGRGTPQLEELRWSKGEGAKRTAFLCYSSGTSGLPKGVMISHRNVIANILQVTTYDKTYRQRRKEEDPSQFPEKVLGLLPFSHIYGLVVIAHCTIYNGDGVVVLPKFEMASFLTSIQAHKINLLYLVPPIVIGMANNKAVLDKFDLSSVTTVFTGAAPLGAETADSLLKIFPHWNIRQGYGLTETCTVVTSTSGHDIWFGSCGSIIPGFEVKLMTPEGKEVTEYDQPGELWAKSPSVVLGYLNNDAANKETFVDGYMRTGDEAVVRRGPNGHEHIFIVDRIKELIKVKGLQVAPAELEAHLLTHEAVADCAVIAVPHPEAGEVPKAFVVRSAKSGGIEDSPRLLAREIAKHVEKDKARHKWLKGGIEFVDEIPKSPSGKILRRFLRDKEKEKRRKEGAKI